MSADASHKRFPVIQTKHKGRNITYIVVDPAIVGRLSIDEETCSFEQGITDGGLIFKLVRKGAAA